MTLKAAPVVLCLGIASLHSQEADAIFESKLEDYLVMCEPGELVLAEDFEPETVSDRWWFRGEFALRDGALVRTAVNADKLNQRVFLKNAAFHNVVVEFLFQFDGETTDLRLVTGSGGKYNTIVQIRREHFQINTADDKEAGIVPSHVGERAFRFIPGRWARMTVEFFGDEVLAMIDGNVIDHIYGSHPIIDRTRTYLAFQFDRPGAKIGAIRIWKADRQRENWPERRHILRRAGKASSENSVERDPDDRYKYAYTNVRSRLTLTDPEYRELTKRHASLKEDLRTRYPEAFRTHKELAKSIAQTKKRLKSEDAGFQSMETKVHRARRAEDAYVTSRFPDLESLPRHRFLSEHALRRSELEQANDVGLSNLVTETRRRQKALEARFPQAFVSVDVLVEKRDAKRRALNADPEFQKRNREVADAWQAIKRYEFEAEPNLRALEEARKAYLNDRRKAESEG